MLNCFMCLLYPIMIVLLWKHIHEQYHAQSQIPSRIPLIYFTVQDYRGSRSDQRRAHSAHQAIV